MRIARKLAILSALPQVLVVAVGAVAFTTYQVLNEGRTVSRIAAVLETQVFALVTLTYDYLRYHEERAREQWLHMHMALGQTLAAMKTAEPSYAATERLRADYQALGEVFRQLVAFRDVPKPELPAPLAAERESWLVARLLLHAQSAFSDAVQAREIAEGRNEEQQALFFATTFVLLVVAGTLVAVLAWRTSTGIRASLLRLHRAAEAIAAGNFDYRADAGTRDEHAELAQALNTMARNLGSLQRQVVQSEKLAAVGTLAAGIAHELNNPLMGVMGYVAYSRNRVREPEAKGLLGEAERELNRMRDLLKNLLSFARPIDERRVEVHIPAVFERALALLHQEFEAKGITVTTAIAGELPPVAAKEGHLQQVFVNLLLNARDALADRVDKTIRIAMRRENDALIIEVADNGTGIPEPIQERIFEPFFTTKPPGQGTGLGLSVVRNVLADLNGTIRCESRVEEGATFIVELPLTPPGPKGRGEEATYAKTDSGHR